jgi:hypothetical protein
MRNRFAGPLITFLAALMLSPVASAQPQRGANTAQEGKVAAPAGPAPKRDLNGLWVVQGGYGLGTGNRPAYHPFPPMTPLGEARFKENKPEPVVGLANSNDPFGTCDPLGFPRNVLNQQGFNASMRFIELPDRMMIVYQFQRVWREIWKDGRQLPAKVDAKGAPDARYYGFSVGRWDGDYSFVIDTVGTDNRTWLDNEGHPHSSDLHVVERYTRLDQNTLALTLTINDPQIYTKPFDWITNAKLYTKPDPDFSETLCLPSEALTYRESLVVPTGVGSSGPAK